MFNFRKKKTASAGSSLQWDPKATQALEQALKQAPIPSMLKNRVKKELIAAAEETARAAGHTTVTAEDMMNGFLARMPADMRSKVEQAMQQGPEGLKNLENELKGKKS